MKKIILLVIVIFTVIGISFVEACSCAGYGTPKEAFDESSAVFVGKVIDIAHVDSIDHSFPTRLIMFEVNESWKGESKKEILVYTGFGGGDCGYEFKIGENYLVYAYGYEDSLNTGICTRTKEFKYAQEDLKKLWEITKFDDKNYNFLLLKIWRKIISLFFL